jgi:hypothetical protein
VRWFFAGGGVEELDEWESLKSSTDVVITWGTE